MAAMDATTDTFFRSMYDTVDYSEKYDVILVRVEKSDGIRD